MIKVVSGIILREGRVLLQQRLRKRDFPLTWECPGGKREGDETELEALRRELEEEVGCLGSDAEFHANSYYHTTFRPPQSGVKQDFAITFLVVQPRPGWIPKMLDAEGLGWFTQVEMGHLELTPGNKRLWLHMTQLDDHELVRLTRKMSW